ncbi:hypothetical protein KX729_28160 [Rhizobium sp. XQZ8]|uniref:hypothetical protein n=1 Tax=Rhizobium populisoli TaxID=2859785 RepID=UPI001CA58720|nr:hypothetical protein [Rhizobium populisoli]MBW6425310.1 hypothetical protein [Rhizobium populisoli]
MTFGEETRAISADSSRTAIAAARLNHSLLPDGCHVNENGRSAFGNNLPDPLESISVGKVAATVVIPSDMAKQVADAMSGARYSFREEVS